MARKAASLLTYSGLYSLSHPSKRGVSISTPDLLEFCENGDLLDARRIYFSWKRSVQRAIFLEKISRSHNFREGAGGHGRWRNPISQTRFFFHFLFHFHNIMKHCIDRHAIISVSHNCSLLSLTYNRRRKITNIPPRSHPPPQHHPFPTTPITPSVEEFSLTRIDSVSVLLVLAILDHWPKLWVHLSLKSPIVFRPNF